MMIRLLAVVLFVLAVAGCGLWLARTFSHALTLLDVAR